MTRLLVLLTVVALAAPAEAMASEWWIISQGDNEERVTLADAQSILPAPASTMTIWTHLFYKDPPPGEMTNAKIQYRVRCSDRSVQQLRFHDYDADRNLLEVVDQTGKFELRPIAPDSVGDVMVNFVCTPKKRNTDFIPVPKSIDPYDLAAFFISGKRISKP